MEGYEVMPSGNKLSVNGNPKQACAWFSAFALPARVLHKRCSDEVRSGNNQWRRGIPR
jgi:hypothetical protein